MANITFTIPSVLNAGGGEKKTEISAESLQDAFIKISEIQGDDFKRRVLEADNTPRSLINIYINGKNAKFASGMDTPLNDGDEVYILPAVAGGSDLSEKELDELRGKKTKLILYTYDSFLFDFSEDEKEIMDDIQDVFNKYKFNIKIKQGYDYDFR